MNNIPNPEHESADSPELEAVRTALDSLPDRYRTPLTLHFFGGLDRNEAAEALGIPTITLAKQLERGIERLRDKLARAGFAVTTASLLLLISEMPTYAASEGFIASLTATRRLAQASRHLPAGKGLLVSKLIAAAVIAGAAAATIAQLSSPAVVQRPAPSIAQAVSVADDLADGTMAIPGTIALSNFDQGGEGVAYHDMDQKNLASNVWRPGEGVDTDGFGIEWVEEGEWVSYTVHVVKTGTYTLAIPVFTQGGGSKLHINFNGVNKTGTVEVPNSGGWDKQALVTKSVHLDAGVQTMQIVFDSNGESGFACSLDDIKAF